MRVTTESEWEALLRKRSLILNQPTNDIHRPPRFFQMFDFSKQGLERMIEERTGANGSLPFHRQQVKDALKAWDTYNSRQPIKAPKPLGVWQEQISKGRAWVRTIEAECREINRLLDIERAKEAKGQKAAQKSRGIMKMRNGVLVAVDGRAVVEGEDGEFIFADDKSSVREYLDTLNRAQREVAKAKAAVNKARHEQLAKLYGAERTKIKAVVPTV